MATAEDLRIELGEPAEQWTEHDIARANQILGRCRTRVIAHIGKAALERATDADDLAALGLIDEVTISYAARRFSNPEQTLQQRDGADKSVSWGDGSEAASGLTSAEKRALSDAFAVHRGRGRGKAFVVPYGIP